MRHISVRAEAKTAMSKLCIPFRLPWNNNNRTSFRAVPGHLVCLLARDWARMKVNNIKFKKSTWQESYIFVTLFAILLSHGCAFFSGLSESGLQVVESPPVLVYEQPTEPVVSDSPTPVESEHSRAPSSLKKPLSKQEIRKIQARLKAAGFDPGPVDGILGPKTRSVLLRVQAGCTIINELVATADGEIFAPAAETQASELTGSANTLSKAEIQLLQKRLKAAGFDPGPADGIVGARTRSALSRCKSGCTALNDLSGTSDKPVLGQITEIQPPRTSVSAKPRASVNTVFKNQEIRLAQERLKAAGFDPGPIDGRFGPQTKSALEKYRAPHKLMRSGIEALLDY